MSYIHSLRNSRLALIGLPPIHTPIFIGEKPASTLAELRVPRIITRIISTDPLTVMTALESFFDNNDPSPTPDNRMSGGNPHA
jgi:hypothetical protein